MSTAHLTSPDRDVIAAVAVTLERLVARITRDLDVDASEGVAPNDPEWAATIAGVVSYARECAAVLDEPTVFTALTQQAPCPDLPLRQDVEDAVQAARRSSS